MKPLLVCALAAVALPGLAHAAEDDMSCTNEPRSAWMTPDAATVRIHEAGYQEVRAIKVIGSCYEILAFTRKHGRADVYMNPVTAEIVRAEVEN
ncbi:PepSY domain-containing protein [Ensifer aridi]|uniref:PepSY domain-containing protein n=1 Tax=Ensifer aridi TaxID=1708715 RepID=UPI0006153179|nr:PepSY domain-containing protein [Ensifer aridi]